MPVNGGEMLEKVKERMTDRRILGLCFVSGSMFFMFMHMGRCFSFSDIAIWIGFTLSLIFIPVGLIDAFGRINFESDKRTS